MEDFTQYGDYSAYAKTLWDNLVNSGIPGHNHEALFEYILRGRTTGGFLQAVLMNMLRESCERADHMNQAHLLHFVRFMVNDAPASCWGGFEEVKAWQKRGGLLGLLTVKGAKQ